MKRLITVLVAFSSWEVGASDFSTAGFAVPSALEDSQEYLKPPILEKAPIGYEFGEREDSCFDCEDFFPRSFKKKSTLVVSTKVLTYDRSVFSQCN